MKRTGLALVAAALALCACGGAGVSAARFATGVEHGSITAPGVERTYRLFVPPAVNAGRTLPLLVALHGCGNGENGDHFAAESGLDDKAAASGFIVAYPDGDGGCWSNGYCCPPADDVAFIRAFIGRLVVQYPVDRARVFVTGFSGGGAMVLRLACELADKIRAVASVSGAFVVSTCSPARPISVLEMHGAADQTTPLGGGVFGIATPAVQTYMSDWAQRDGCSADPASSSGGIVKATLWTGCGGKTSVRLDLITGGHHTWFGSDIDPVPGEPSSTDVVWSFFSNLVEV